MYIYTCNYVCVYLCMSVCLSVCTYVGRYVRMYAHEYRLRPVNRRSFETGVTQQDSAKPP